MNKRIRKKKADQKKRQHQADLAAMRAWCLGLDARVARWYAAQYSDIPFYIGPDPKQISSAVEQFPYKEKVQGSIP